MSKKSTGLIVFGWFLQYLKGILGLPFPFDACPSLWAMRCTLRPPEPRAAPPLSLFALGAIVRHFIQAVLFELAAFDNWRIQKYQGNKRRGKQGLRWHHITGKISKWEDIP